MIYTGTDSWTAATTREEFMGRASEAGISEQITSGSGYILIDITHHEPAGDQGLFKQIHTLYRAATEPDILMEFNSFAKLLHQLQLQPELAQHIEMFVESIAALIKRRTGVQIDPQTIRDKILNKDKEANMSLLFSEELVAAHERELLKKGKAEGKQEVQQEAEKQIKEVKQEANKKVKEAKQETKEAKQETAMAKRLLSLSLAVAKAGRDVIEAMSQAEDPKKREALFAQYGIS